MQPSSKYSHAALYHPFGYQYYDQQLPVYGTIPAAATAQNAAPFSYMAPVALVQESGLPPQSASTEDSAVSELGPSLGSPGAAVMAEADGNTFLHRLTFVLTAVSVCAVLGLLMTAAAAGRHMLFFGELTEPNTDAPFGLMDLKFRHSLRPPTNDTAKGTESVTQPILEKMELVPSGNHKVDADVLEGTDAHMRFDIQDDTAGAETTAALPPVTQPPVTPPPVTPLKKRSSPSPSYNSDQPQLNNYEGVSRCGRAQFVFCGNETSAFYHVAGADGGTCLVSTRGHPNICNRSPNGFSSLSDCERFCVDRKHPQKRCGGPAIFSTCARMDMKKHWWFHDGLSCRQWQYPSGTCPSANSDTYGTFQECYNRCAHHAERDWVCRQPQPVACAKAHIRHPYFAVSSGDGMFRCLEASPDNLRGHICLTGKNNFKSSEACQKACGNKPVA
ncbi:uncharacterized protein [Dermacentor albipictus]|uniref:uncharacterized protein isoform X3 n=1 Tax=Dermacentor albipictus TaxID=60249 RepID=UPI0031FE0133